MRLYQRLSYETIHEIDYDGDTGSLMGFLIDGHVDLDDVDLFLATSAEEELYFDPPMRGFDIEHVWWRTTPFYDDEGTKTDSFIYVYDADDSKGGKPATKLEIESTWEKRCVRHPFEVAANGISKHSIPEDQADLADEHGTVYLCEECYTDWNRRRNEQIDRILAEQQAKR